LALPFEAFNRCSDEENRTSCRACLVAGSGVTVFDLLGIGGRTSSSNRFDGARSVTCLKALLLDDLVGRTFSLQPIASKTIFASCR